MIILYLSLVWCVPYSAVLVSSKAVSTGLARVGIPHHTSIAKEQSMKRKSLDQLSILECCKSQSPVSNVRHSSKDTESAAQSLVVNLGADVSDEDVVVS